MRGRFSLGVILIFAILLGISSLGLNQPAVTVLAQFTFPASPTPTDTPGATTPVPPTSTFTQPPPSPTPTSPGGTPATATTPPTGAPPSATVPPGTPSTKEPKPQGEPATPSIGIKLNKCARVVWPNGLDLFDGPGFNASHLFTVGLNDIVFVIDGPQRSDGLWWWKVNTRDGVTGWGENDHLSPYSGECFGAVVLTPAVSAVPLVVLPTALQAQRVIVATAAADSQSQLPATGAGDGGLLFAGVLVAVLLIAGLVRRRTQSTS